MKNVTFVLFFAILVCGFNIDASAQTYTRGRETSENGSRLLPGKSLYPGEKMEDPNSNFTLRFTLDGEIQTETGMTDRDPIEWKAGTAGKGGVRLIMQADGNLVLYKSSGTDSSDAVWSSGTHQPVNSEYNFLEVDSRMARIYYAGKTKILK